MVNITMFKEDEIHGSESGIYLIIILYVVRQRFIEEVWEEARFSVSSRARETKDSRVYCYLLIKHVDMEKPTLITNRYS